MELTYVLCCHLCLLKLRQALELKTHITWQLQIVMIFGTWPAASYLQPHHTTDDISYNSSPSRVILLKCNLITAMCDFVMHYPQHWSTLCYYHLKKDFCIGKLIQNGSRVHHSVSKISFYYLMMCDTGSKVYGSM